VSHCYLHTAALVWFALVAVCVFWKVALTQQVLYWGDLMLYFLPMVSFAQRWLTQGILPFWNPHILWGQPYLGNPQEWLFYPSTILLQFLHPARYLSWNSILHLWLGGVGMWLFLHTLHVPHRPALLASTAWMLCGAFVPRAQFPGMFQSIALIGWLLWATEQVLQRPSLLRTAVLAVILAMLLLAGHPQVAYMALLLATARVVWRWRIEKPRAHALLAISAGVVGGVLLSAAHWLPMLQLLQETGRVQLSVWGANRFPLRLEQLPMLLVPDLYGTPWQGNYLGRGNYWEVACAVGILPLMAAFSAWRTRPDARFWLFVAAISLWLSLGTTGGLYILAYYLLPGMKAFHDPARWLIIADFALCIAAAMGWERLHFSRKWLWLPAALGIVAVIWMWRGTEIIAWAARNDVIRASRPETVSETLIRSAHATATLGGVRTLTLALLAVTILRLSASARWGAGMVLLLMELLPFAMHANPTCDIAVFEQPPRSAQIVARSAGRVFVPDQVPMWRSYVSYVDYGSNAIKHLRHWQEMLGSNIGMMWELSEISGYEPVAVKNAMRYYLYLVGVWKKNLHDIRLLRQLQYTGTGAIATGTDATNWCVFRLPYPPRRAWISPSDQSVPVKDMSPQFVQVSNPPAGVLVIADTAYPGWRVYIDGLLSHQATAHPLFRSVVVPRSGAVVRWRYEPDTFRCGLYLSLFGVAMVSGAAIFAWVAGRSSDSAK
jgi:hypothetical protein